MDHENTKRKLNNENTDKQKHSHKKAHGSNEVF